MKNQPFNDPFKLIINLELARITEVATVVAATESALPDEKVSRWQYQRSTPRRCYTLCRRCNSI